MNEDKVREVSYLYVDDWGYLHGTLTQGGKQVDARIAGVTYSDRWEWTCVVSTITPLTRES